MELNAKIILKLSHFLTHYYTKMALKYFRAIFMRRDGDSNPGYPFGVYTLSRRAS